MTAPKCFSASSPSSSYFDSNQFTLQDSPPSLIFSDFSEDIEPAVMTTNGSSREDVSTILQDVLGYMEQVVEHLRDKGENDAANTISKNMINVVSTFNDTTAPWDLEHFFMTPRALHRPVPISNAKGQPISSTIPMASNWASVAARPVEGRNSLIKYRPSDGLKRHITGEEAAKEKDTSRDVRVVWLQGWPRDRPLAEVTENLNQGAILSMVYSEEYSAVCVIFQHATSVRDLLVFEDYYRQQKGVSIFGRGYNIVPGLPYPESEDLRRMGNPINERRRLTFARSQLFAHGMSERQFKRDIYDIVGESNVELVWLFNTGNATVVFTSTAIARLVRDEFRRAAKTKGPYRDVQVSFSHDPCEKPLNLITQIPSGDATRGRALSNISGNSNTIIRGAGADNSGVPGLTRQNSRRKHQVDADGWETIVKKR